MTTYMIVRFYQRHRDLRKVIKRGVSLEEAQRHCRNPETSWRTCHKPENRKRTADYGPWFDGYTEES